ncbi:DUF6934 family protein [Dyadobacter sp. CY323]|uniref:DUF6934 family protein n=1 Tax=Dyadobacter sp. CY323 TaxID=2907302 RepID=UPI001F338389|nr:hypothetical protein [Dyadobacter sp. CY323]MCE6989628.1 hypothetical protein [Dyadobacter sp. CY323]
MNHPSYEFSNNEKSVLFTFDSVGSRIIPKGVLFQQTGTPNLFNVIMGDVDSSGNIDVYSESNNGDMENVLSTVIQIITHFLATNKDAIICIQGSTPARTRLYRILLCRELNTISKHFRLLGFGETELELFEPGKTYRAFVISSKNV